MTLKYYWSILIFACLIGITITSCKKEEEKISFMFINDGVYIGANDADFKALILCSEKPNIKKLGLVVTDFTTLQTENYSLDSLANFKHIHLHIQNLTPFNSYIYQFYAETPYEKVYTQLDTVFIGKP